MKPEIKFPKEFPIITTDRLELVPFQLKDSQDLFDLRSNNEFMKYLGRHPMKEVSEAEQHIQRILDAFEKGEGLNWKIQLKGTSTLIGYIGFWRIVFSDFYAEIGFGMSPKHQGKGYTSEAIKAALNYGFKQLGLHSVLANIDPLNLASASVLKKSGFRKEGYARENYYFDGVFLDTESYGVLEKDIL